MTGPMDWGMFLFICGVIAAVLGPTIAVTWTLRGYKAETREELMKTAEIITDKISQSRQFLRMEMQEGMGKLEGHVDAKVEKLEANVASVASELKMHRAEDATSFRAIGERIARLEGV